MKLRTGIKIVEKKGNINVIVPKSILNDYAHCFVPIGVKVQSVYMPSIRMNIREWFDKHF